MKEMGASISVSRRRRSPVATGLTFALDNRGMSEYIDVVEAVRELDTEETEQFLARYRDAVDQGIPRQLAEEYDPITAYEVGGVGVVLYGEVAGLKTGEAIADVVEASMEEPPIDIRRGRYQNTAEAAVAMLFPDFLEEE